MGMAIKATKIKSETNTNLILRILILIYLIILSLKEYIVATKYACAVISKTINTNIIILLNNLYKSLSNFIPKNIEWTVRAIAEPTPKKIIFLRFLWFLLKRIIISLL